MVEADRDCLMQNVLKYVLYTDCIVKIYPLRILYQIPHNFLRKKSNCIIDIQIYFWYIWIAERNYGTFGQCFQVRKHTIMYRHSFWIRFLPHNADYVVLTGNIARIQFCPQYTAACLCMEQIVRSVVVHSNSPPL